MMALQDLVDKRARLWEESKAILKKAEDEKREQLAPEESAKFDAIHAEMESLKATIDRIQRSDAVERELTESRGRKSDPAPLEPRRSEHSDLPVRRPLADFPRDDELSRLEALRVWLLAGSTERNKLSDGDLLNAKRLGFDPNQKVLDINFSRRAMRTLSQAETWQYEETRALAVGTGSAGLFTVPNEMMRPLEIALLTYGGMRQVATVIRTQTGANLPIPTVNDTTNMGEIINENSAVNQQDVAFGQLVLGAFKYSSKMILVSVELMQDNAINLANFLGTALGTRIGRITNNHFTVGVGTTQPKGLVVGATSGKVGLVGETTSLIFDDLVDLEHSVDPAYRQNGRFMFHDKTLAAAKKLKDSQGRPLFLPGLSLSAPDTILGYPYTINQDVAQMSANAKSVLFGDLSKYIIRDVLGITLLRLDERYAEFHQVAFLAFARFDGNLLDAGTHPVKYFANSAT
jgi:HK97 family phage major capsid protein